MSPGKEPQHWEEFLRILRSQGKGVARERPPLISPFVYSYYIQMNFFIFTFYNQIYK